jgi:hypothetical protein
MFVVPSIPIFGAICYISMEDCGRSNKVSTAGMPTLVGMDLKPHRARDVHAD